MKSNYAKHWRGLIRLFLHPQSKCKIKLKSSNEVFTETRLSEANCGKKKKLL